MNKKEIRAKVTEMLSSGVKKQDVFNALSDKGIKDRRLAFLIASHVNAQRCTQNKWHIRAAIGIVCLQLIWGLLVSIMLALRLALVDGLIVGALLTLISLFFIWGFAKNKAGIYSVFIILGILGVPRQMQGFEQQPLETAIGLVLSLVIVGYIVFVRYRLFPDLYWYGPRKAGGAYVFTD